MVVGLMFEEKLLGYVVISLCSFWLLLVVKKQDMKWQ